METEIKNRLYKIFIAVLILGNIFFIFNYFSLYKEQQTFQREGDRVELNQKVIDFTSLFIKKVLQADKEVDFETRLTLENSVRDLKDEAILVEWQKFTNSKSEMEAQTSVKNLLGILVGKIQK